MISYSIMAHPARRRYAHALSQQLDAPIAWDEKGDRWDTGRRAWELASGDWHVVIQDDAVLPLDFVGGVERALARVPEVPLVLYAGGTREWWRVWDTIPEDTSYLIMRRIVWGVGIALPAKRIRPALEYGDRSRRDVRGHYDLRLSLYFEARRIPVWYSWPSLVDHRNGPSLIPGRGGNRHAYCYCRTAPGFDGPIVDLSRKIPLM